MKISKNGLLIIKHFESCRLKAYKPLADDVWTIGWGHTQGVIEGDICTQSQADIWLMEDIEQFCNDVNYLLLQDVSQNQFDALVSFAYNCGSDIDVDTIPEGLGDSTLLKKVNAGESHAAALEFLKWNKSKGRVVSGLTRRRNVEANLFLTPDDQPFRIQ